VALTLIPGPPGSGRAAEILDRFAGSLDRDPVLVVPTADDVGRFERELCARPDGLLGGAILSFPRLYEQVASAAGSVDQGRPLSRMQRTWLLRAATQRVPLALLRRSAVQAGFAPALETLVTELQAAGIDASAFAERAAELPDGAYERELAALFAEYESMRDGLERSDAHQSAARATAALRTDPASWRGRPVFFYGFDDLVREQIELISALADASEVTFAVLYEDRAALAARSELPAILREELGGKPEPARTPRRGDRAETLFHLERALFEPEPARVTPDGSLSLLSAHGQSGEAELIGRRVAALIAAGADPGEIAIAVRNPSGQAPALARALGRLGVPAAAEAQLPLAATATGARILDLLAISGSDGTAQQVVSVLRSPSRSRPGPVDWFERKLRRNRIDSCSEALALWAQDDNRDIWELSRLSEAIAAGGRAPAEALGSIARTIAERPHRHQAPVLGAGAAVELRAAIELEAALLEATELGGHAPKATELGEFIAHLQVSLWRGPTEGRVRILSPYRLRASDVRHLFVAGLNDGVFPGRGAVEPLLSGERRRALGLTERRQPIDEERFLFHTCLARPRASLALSWIGSDDAAEPAARSPFVDDVRALLAPPPGESSDDDELERKLTTRRDPGARVPSPTEATGTRDLARAIAPLRKAGSAALAALEIPDGVREEVEAMLAEARLARDAAAAPGPLRSPAVLDALATRRLFGASTLEEYGTCSYIWFTRHELNPRSIDPDPDPLADGGLMHTALEELYRSRPEGQSNPTMESVEAWIEAAEVELKGAALGRGWDLDSASARISLAKVRALIARFLRRDSLYAGPLKTDPTLLEASFGAGPSDQFPPAEIGSFQLHGKIDRIDVSDDGKALIRDYKSSKSVTPADKFISEGKLQIPLYIRAAQGFPELGLNLVGGLYHPMGGTSEDRPRGLLDKDEKGSLLAAETAAHVKTDFKDNDEFAALLVEAEEAAQAIVAQIQAGRITRDPREGECPKYCAYGSICRIERGLPEPSDEDEDEKYQ